MLWATQCSGFGVGPFGKVRRALTASASDSTDSNTHTFSAQSIGTQSPDRFIVVAVSVTGGTSAGTLSGVTVGGVAATRAIAATVNGAQAELWYTPRVDAGGPTGTGATVVVTTTGSPAALNCTIALYAITGAVSPIPFATVADIAAPLSVSLDVPLNGIAIAVARAAVTPGNATWSGLTEDTDQAADGGVSVGTSASNEFSGAQSAMAVGVTFAAGTATNLSAASWGP